MSELMLVRVQTDSLKALTEGVDAEAKGSVRAELCVLDFYTAMAMEGHAFQVQAGTITTPLTGSILIAATAAEMCVDAQTGLTVIPVYLGVTGETKGTSLPECAAKSVGVISSSGTLFIPLPLKMGGLPSQAIARVQAAGSVTVTAELVTTTRVHFHNIAAEIADRMLADHNFRVPPVLVGPACFYVQVAASTAGPTYFGNLDFIEMPTVSVS